MKKWKGNDSGLRHERNVEVVSDNGEKIGRGISEWCVVNKLLHTPVMVDMRSDLQSMNAPCRQRKPHETHRQGGILRMRLQRAPEQRPIHRPLLPDRTLSLIAPVRLDVNFKREIPCGA